MEIARAKATAEPFTFGIEANVIADYLGARGFDEVRDAAGWYRCTLSSSRNFDATTLRQTTCLVPGMGGRPRIRSRRWRDEQTPHVSGDDWQFCRTLSGTVASR